ncbi:MAG TPA: addiction module protein [Longimicrobium sp.]|nr:addiction module protein [Longimicrobium sp.]
MSLPALKLDPEIEEVESAALQLPREARARIAERLIASLDEETRAEQAWAEEVRRRVRDFRSGQVRTRPVDDVLDEVDELLR